MGEITVKCANCVGPVEVQCESKLQAEATQIRTVQMMDEQQLDYFENNPDKSDEFKSELKSATLQESADLVDYRHQVLFEELGNLGCGLNISQVKLKLTLKLADL